VALVITDKWLGIVPLVRILVVAGLLRALAATGGALFQAMGRPDLDFKMQLPRFLLLVLAIYPAAKYFGVSGVCAACLLSILGCFPHWFVGVKALLGVGPVEVLRSCLAGFGLSVPLAVLLWASNLMPTTQSWPMLSAPLAVLTWALLVWRGGKAFGYDVVKEARELFRPGR